MENNTKVRVAIIINNKLNRGEASNVCAILMGQLAIKYPNIYSDKYIIDQSNYIHSGIKCNIIILKSQENQLYDFCLKLSEDELIEKLNVIIFTEEGRQLSNEFNEYEKIIHSNKLIDLCPIAIIIVGNENYIRELTRDFNLY